MSKRLHPAIFADSSIKPSPFSFYGPDGKPISQTAWQYLKDSGSAPAWETFVGSVRVRTFWTGIDNKPVPALRELLPNVPFIWETVMTQGDENTYIEGYADDETACERHKFWVNLLYSAVTGGS